MLKKVCKKILILLKCEGDLSFEEIQILIGNYYDDEQIKDAISVLLDKDLIDFNVDKHIYFIKT